MTTAISALTSKVLALFRPPPNMTLSEWADEYYYLSPESSADPGKWKTRSYQREIMDTLTDPDVEWVSLMKSSRVGYTKIINADVGYHAHFAPCSILLVSPALDDAEQYSKEEIFPMIRDCPCLQDVFAAPEIQGPKATTLHKLFRGGALQLVGANSPRGFRRTSRKRILLDEVDAYPISAGKEGDPVRLAVRRSEAFPDRKIIEGSTPTIDGHSRIQKSFELGDQRHFYVPCPHCKEKQVLKFRRDGQGSGGFVWPEGKPELAEYACGHCGVLIDHGAKEWMLENGEWRAHAPENLARYRRASFHIWAAYSHSPNATWGQIATEFVQAEKDGVEALKTFVNTVLGEVWKDRGEAPEWERLYQRREDYAIGTIPVGGLLLTSGVDVQKDRIEYEVVAWGRGKRSWSVDKGILLGDTSTNEPWDKLDKLLDRAFPHANGGDMQIAAMAVDSGFNTQQVYAWVRGHSASRVLAVKGMATSSTLLGAPKPVDVTISGRRMTRGTKMWPVGVNIAKSELYGWLRQHPPTDEDAEKIEGDEKYPPGFLHFPQYGEDYFKQLTAEQLVPHKTRHGFVRLEWEIIPGRRNEGLDCRVYARAASAFFGIDRFDDGDWSRLEESSGVQIKTERVTPTTGAQRKRGHGKQPWIQRKRGGWLDKGD